jgi:excisionase family DNA binding protein
MATGGQRLATLEKEVARLRDVVIRTKTKEDLVSDGAVTVDEACQFLGLKKSTVYVLMDDGTIPSLEIRGRKLIPKKALVELLASKMTGGANATGGER